MVFPAYNPKNAFAAIRIKKLLSPQLFKHALFVGSCKFLRASSQIDIEILSYFGSSSNSTQQALEKIYVDKPNHNNWLQAMQNWLSQVITMENCDNLTYSETSIITKVKTSLNLSPVKQ